MRVVIEQRCYRKFLNQLQIYFPQTSFGANVLALKNGMPTQLGTREILETFIEYRIEIIVKRTTFDLLKAKEKEHLLLGLAVAIENIDEMIELIRNSKDTNEAHRKIVEKKWNSKNLANLLKKTSNERFTEIISNFSYLSSEQVKAILELRLQRLTGLEKK